MARKRKPNSTGNKPSASKPQRDPDAKEADQTPKDQNPDSDSSKEANAANKTGINDPSWYQKFPELSFGAGNLSFGELLGSPMKYSDLDLSIVNSENQKVVFEDRGVNDAVPGICSLITKPSYGFSTDLNDPLNVAATQYYANVRYVNSGRKNYDPADLMLATMTIADLFAFINWAQRLYGYAYMYSMRNKYINAALIEANHVNSRNIVEHLANFRYWLNTFIARVSAFAVPASINIFQRRAFMYAHLYTESITGNIKDQLYQFVPDGFYQFALDATGKGALRYITLDSWADTQWTTENIYSYGEMLLSNISGDEDFGLITGDIIKAYGSNIISMAPVPEALYIVPEYEEYTLSQMKNAHLVPDLLRGSSKASFKLDGNDDETFMTGDIMQANNGNLISVEGVNRVNMSARHMYQFMPGIITVTNPTPSVDDVFEATRLVTTSWPTASDKIRDGDNVTVICSGSDIVIKWIMSEYAWDFTSDTPIYKLYQYNITEQMALDANPSDDKVWLSEHFHWAPINFLYSIRDGEGDVDYYMYNIRTMGNVDNYTSLSWRNVANLHEAAMISLLSVPGVATLVG